MKHKQLDMHWDIANPHRGGQRERERDRQTDRQRSDQ